MDKIYGFDLKAAAKLTRTTELSAAAKRALQLYEDVPEVGKTWKHAIAEKQRPLTAEERQRQYFEIKEKEMTRDLAVELKAVSLRHLVKGRVAPLDEEKNTQVQFGTVIEGPTQFYSQRLVKKDRKKTLAEQILAQKDAKINSEIGQMRTLEEEERITRYKTQIKLNRRGSKHKKLPKRQ